MADKPSVKWLGLGAATGTKSSVARDGERKKREAEVEYSQSLPPSPQSYSDGWVGINSSEVSATASAAAPLTNTPSQAELAVLQDLGWKTPGLDSPAGKNKSENIFNYQDKRIEKSHDFDYGLNEQQIKNLEDLYRDMPGYEPPDEDTVTSIRVMAEKNELAPVTWKQWDKMTPDQRKAATWNTQLWKATQKDIKLAGKRAEQNWTPEEQQQYDERVTAIFGENGGSEIRAISTLNLLEKIDFTAVGQDLDEYLAGERLITEDEMKNFKVGTAEPIAGQEQTTTERKRLPFSIGPVTPAAKPENSSEDVTTTRVTNYDEIRSATNLANLDAAAVRALDNTIRDRMSSSDTFGWNMFSTLSDKKKLTPEDFPIGYSNPGVRHIDPDSYQAQKEAWFKDMWFNLNDSDQKLEDVVKDIQVSMSKGKFPAKLQQEVWDWIDKRTAWHSEYGQPTDFDYPLRDPNEIRKALGWEK